MGVVQLSTPCTIAGVAGDRGWGDAFAIQSSQRSQDAYDGDCDDQLGSHLRVSRVCGLAPCAPAWEPSFRNQRATHARKAVAP